MTILDISDATPASTAGLAVFSLDAVFQGLIHLSLRSTQLSWILWGAMLKAGTPGTPRLETFHFQSLDPIASTVVKNVAWGPPNTIPAVTHIATQLRFLSTTPIFTLTFPSTLT